MSNYNTLKNMLVNEYSKMNSLKIKNIFNELKNNTNNMNIENIPHNLANLLIFTYKMGFDININLDDVVYLVHESNMSKLCLDEQEAIDTVSEYIKQYNSGKSPYDTPMYKKSNDEKYYIVYNESTNKILKSIKYNIVNLVPLIFYNEKIDHDGASNYDKVNEFNTIFQAKSYDNLTIQVLQDKKFVNLRLGLIEEEINELLQAISDNDIIEIVDALGDILYVVYGMINTMGLYEAVQNIYENNLLNSNI